MEARRSFQGWRTPTSRTEHSALWRLLRYRFLVASPTAPCTLPSSHPSPSVSSLPQLVSGVRACAHRLLSTSPPVRVRPAGIPMPQFASHASNCFSFHRFPACQAHYKLHLAQISDSVGDLGDGFGCVLSKHEAPIISFYSTLLAFNNLWSY